VRAGFADEVWVLHYAVREGHNPSACAQIPTAQLGFVVYMRWHVASGVWFVIKDLYGGRGISRELTSAHFCLRRFLAWTLSRN
jgi:hypothetical protein